MKTERLLLRPWKASDFDPFAQLNADPAVMEHFPSTLSRTASDDFAARQAAHIDEHGWGAWALEVRDGPDAARFAGMTGLMVPSWDAPFMPCVELGWRLPRWAWGRGYATEAAHAAASYAFETLGLEEIVAYTAKTNLRSQAVMKRLDMVHDPASDFDHPRLPARHPLRPHVLYRLRKPR